MDDLPDPEAVHDMANVRFEIDALDRTLVRLLARRMRFIERAGTIKSDRAAVRDEWRKADVISKVCAAAREDGFPEQLAAEIWDVLVEGSIAHEFDVFDAR